MKEIPAERATFLKIMDEFTEQRIREIVKDELEKQSRSPEEIAKTISEYVNRAKKH